MLSESRANHIPTMHFEGSYQVLTQTIIPSALHITHSHSLRVRPNFAPMELRWVQQLTNTTLFEISQKLRIQVESRSPERMTILIDSHRYKTEHKHSIRIPTTPSVTLPLKLLEMEESQAIPTTL
jgi:hypothetical protein